MFAFITRFQTFHNTSFIRYQSPMTGGSITRYHTPAMQGRGLKDVISEVGPITTESSQKALSKEQDGKSLSEVGTHFAQDTHDVTKIQTTKLSTLLRFYFHDVFEQLKTNFHTNFRFRRVLGFVIEYA